MSKMIKKLLLIMILTSGCYEIPKTAEKAGVKEPSEYTYYEIKYRDGSYTRVDIRELKYRCIVVAVSSVSGAIAMTTFDKPFDGCNAQ